jgi:hypothetical protein
MKNNHITQYTKLGPVTLMLDLNISRRSNPSRLGQSELMTRAESGYQDT